MTKLSRRIALKVVTVRVAVGILFLFAACTHDDTVQVLSEGGGHFSSHVVSVNGAQLHYVRGGNGPAVLLLHGFPQDWSAYRAIMPRLAANFTVIAPDMRGVGKSRGPLEQYGPTSLTRDLHDLARSLDLESVFIVGHDNGAMLAYAFAIDVSAAHSAASWSSIARCRA